MRLQGANYSTQGQGSQPLPAKVNYFKHRAINGQITGIPTYGKVTYPSIYPGIDLVYHSSERKLEYDFVIAPKADWNAIAIAFEGAHKLEVDGRGELVVHTPVGELRQPKPVIYQEVNGMRQTVVGGFRVEPGQRVRFVLGQHDRTRALVIDPTLAYSTYLGGSGDDQANRIAVDTAGNVYVS